MCRCTPALKTPFCGAPGCEWPAETRLAAALDAATLRDQNPAQNSEVLVREQPRTQLGRELLAAANAAHGDHKVSALALLEEVERAHAAWRKSPHGTMMPFLRAARRARLWLERA